MAIPQHPHSSKTTTKPIMISFFTAFWPSNDRKVYQFINLAPFLWTKYPKVFVSQWYEMREWGKFSCLFGLCALLKSCLGGGRKKGLDLHLCGPDWGETLWPEQELFHPVKQLQGQKSIRRRRLWGARWGKTRSEQHKPWGCAREQIQVSSARDGRETAPCSSRAMEPEGMHWNLLDWARTRILHDNPSAPEGAVSAIRLAGFSLSQKLLCSDKSWLFKLSPLLFTSVPLPRTAPLSVLSPHETLLFFSEKVKRQGGGGNFFFFFNVCSFLLLNSSEADGEQN